MPGPLWNPNAKDDPHGIIAATEREPDQSLTEERLRAVDDRPSLWPYALIAAGIVLGIVAALAFAP